jgi:hypothetical protein
MSFLMYVYAISRPDRADFLAVGKHRVTGVMVLFRDYPAYDLHTFPMF